MFVAAQHNTPIRFMVNPPEGTDSALLRNVYLDTTTLEWHYQPPIPTISLRNPEYMNLSSKYAVYRKCYVTWMNNRLLYKSAASWSLRFVANAIKLWSLP